MFVDSHAHLDDPAFAADLEAVLARAREAGVERIVTIGTDVASSRRASEIAAGREEVWFAAGVHPHEADRPGPVEELEEIVRRPRGVAIGEIGLDYYKNYSSVGNQRALFETQLGLAARLGLPVSIHCREAHEDAIAILRGAGVRGVIHCFSGTAKDAEEYLALGFHLSIAGPVTYPNAVRLREVVRGIPLERLMIETDCPLLAPQPQRGRRNEPAYVQYAAWEIAGVLGKAREEVAAATSRNARAVFGIP